MTKLVSSFPVDDKAVKEYTASGFFVLRTPLLPFKEFLALSEGLAFPQALHDGGDLAAAAAADHELIRRRLLEVEERPEVKESLWLASPEFYEALTTWKNKPGCTKGQRLERALYRYVARMASRPTPFGLFAGCSLGKIAAQTRLQIGPRHEYWRHSRLDMEYLCNLAEKVSSDLAAQRQLYFRSNTSLYQAAGRYHHAQNYLSHDIRCYRLIATQPTPYLTATLERAANPATPVQLAAALVHDDPEISMEEAEDYIHQLIQSQMLVPELVPPITGPEPLQGMLEQLEQAQPPLAISLKSISEHLRKLDEGGLGNDLECYRQIVNAVSQLPCEYKLDHLVQVDMMKKTSEATLDHHLIGDILRGVELLHSLASCAPIDHFEQFKQDFYERYQEQEVPLVLALDDEVGIGFERRSSPESSAESLLENIDFSSEGEPALARAHPWEFVLLRKVEELIEAKKTVLELDARLLAGLRAKNPPPLPDAFAAMVQIISAGDGSEHKEQFYLQSAGGPSGAVLLGRFCSADQQLTEWVKEHLKAEEESRIHPNTVYAEVVHLPEGRVGNVLCRPVLRHYEIPFLARSGVPPENQIPVTDLTVSIRNGQIVLRSQRLGCEVVPRLTSAHAFIHGRNLKLYKFLGLLQAQGVSGALAWSWGMLEELEFLPRVSMGNMVLAPARWRMDKQMMERLAHESSVERLRRMAEWRASHGLPRFVLLAEADNQLLVDFDNALSVETLIEYGKTRQHIHLVEMLTPPGALCVSGPEGSFTHEILVPFVRKKAPPGAEAEIHAKLAVGPARLERNLLPGSEWLYAKIYASPSHLDHLLVEHARPLVAEFLETGAADSWFFIRYSDPHWHLRLRFHGNPRRLNTEVLPALWQGVESLKQQGRIWRMQLDTYERELERYGGPEGMLIAEKLFQRDSELVMELLAAICDQLAGKVRWHLAFAAVDCLLDGLDLEIAGRRRLVNALEAAQQKNFRVNATYKKDLSEKYRQERHALEALLERPVQSPEFPAAATAALGRFAGQVQAIRAELEEARRRNTLTKSIEELAGSYVHMHLNRIFRSAANAQEMVLYDFIARSYDSKLARDRKPLS